MAAQGTPIILDGLFDQELARQLSARWAGQGLPNRVDAAGQWAMLEPPAGQSSPLTEEQVDQAAATARLYGLEIRDRAGATYRADVQLPALRRQMTHEYKSRFATALVFGLPALVLHYLGPTLAGGNVQWASGMVYPWLIELALVGWVCVAAGWPILWQGLLSLRSLRASADLLTSLIMLTSFLPSAWGVLSLLWRDEPWFGRPEVSSGPAFYVANLAVLLATLHRWLLHRAADRIAGRGQLMIPRFNRVVGAWLAAAAIAMLLGSWRTGLALGLVLPPTLAVGAINRWSPGATMLLPVVAFALLLTLAPAGLVGQGTPVRIESAAGFSAMLALVFTLSWQRWGNDQALRTQ